MKVKGLFIPIALSVFLLCPPARSGSPVPNLSPDARPQAWSSSPWLNLSSDKRDVVRGAIIDALNKQRGAYSTPQEDAESWKLIEEDKTREDETHRENIDNASLSFNKARNMRDDLAAQIRSLSTDSNDTLQTIKTIRTTIENIDNALVRGNQEMKAHQKSFEIWLSMEKQGSDLIAVTYTADIKDPRTAALEHLADRTSASLLMAQRKGIYKQSLAKALDRVLSEDFIRGMTDEVFVGNREKALIVVLAKDGKGITYLQLKRYDYYPFQKPKKGQPPAQDDTRPLPVAEVNSLKDLEVFIKKSNHSLSSKDAKEADALIRETAKENLQTEERLNEQLRSLREKTANLQKKIADSRSDRETWVAALQKMESRHEPMRRELEKIRVRMEEAERSFKAAQNALEAKAGIQATIIPVRDAAFLKGSQTPIEAAADAIADKLTEVKQDAEKQYLRNTKEVFPLLKSDRMAVEIETVSRVTAVKPLSFSSEGDIVRIKVAFRVQTTLKEETPYERRETSVDPIRAFDLVLIKGGCFQMGDTFGDGQADEKPVHTVCVEDFYIGKYEVTQGQWQSVMGNNPSFFKNCGEKCPVEQVSWNDIQVFLTKLNAKTGKTYRLPTEAEWEFAARSGGKKEKYAGTSSDSELGKYAWYSANSGGSIRPSGQKQPNGLGLYDMTGNAWEWCQDWYGELYYGQSTRKNPAGPQSGIRRVLRGGAWLFEPAGIRAATRYGLLPEAKGDLYGFRLAISVPK
jgi:formylglycine-generating enzyme required for sulfatase activity